MATQKHAFCCEAASTILHVKSLLASALSQLRDTKFIHAHRDRKISQMSSSFLFKDVNLAGTIAEVNGNLDVECFHQPCLPAKARRDFGLSWAQGK